MSLHYLLDGYNIIKQAPKLADKSLQEGRTALIHWLNVSKPQGNNEVTIVFDGKADVSSPYEGNANVRILFSHGSADDLIKEIVETAANKKNFIVVSDDKDIFIYARDLGARVLKVKEFVSGPKTSPRHAKEGPTKKNISVAHQQIINQELSKLWLKNDD